MRYLLTKPYFSIYSLWRKIHPCRFNAQCFGIAIFHHMPPSQFDTFQCLLDYLSDQHRIISPQEAESILEGTLTFSNNGKIPYLLSFDDGFVSQGVVCERILEPRKIKAVFFVCPGLIDLPVGKRRQAITENVFEGQLSSGGVLPEIDLMGWQELLKLSQNGHAVGSHTMNHRLLAGLNITEQKHELLTSADILEARLHLKARWFAYPFGTIESVDNNSLAIAAERHQFCCSGLRGVNAPTTPHGRLLRQHVDLDSPLEYQRLVLAGGLDFLYTAKINQWDSRSSPQGNP